MSKIPSGAHDWLTKYLVGSCSSGANKPFSSVCCQRSWVQSTVVICDVSACTMFLGSVQSCHLWYLGLYYVGTQVISGGWEWFPELCPSGTLGGWHCSSIRLIFSLGRWTSEFPKTIGPTGKTDRKSKCLIKFAVLLDVTDMLLLTFLEF
jgi:hypothetical protein